MSQFAIAGLQLAIGNGNNLSRVLADIEATHARFPWVKMMVLSELAAFGADPAKALPPGNEAEQAFCELASKCGLWLVPGSIYERKDDGVCNTALAINPDGKVVARYNKMYPFAPYESAVEPGSEFCVFDVPGVGRFGLSICYDKWFPETTRALAFMGAEVIIQPTLTTTIDRDVELAIARANAAINQCYFFDVNTAAPFGMGRSVVVGPGGELIHESSAEQEIFPIEIDLDYLRRVRERGWQGLCQPLKSFRDSKVIYPQYQPGARSDALDQLGKLEIPR